MSTSQNVQTHLNNLLTVAAILKQKAGLQANKSCEVVEFAYGCI